MKFFPIGSIVELLPKYTQIYEAEAGALGIVEGIIKEEGFDYYQIHWDKEDPKTNGQEDGLVDCHHVKLYDDFTEEKKSEHFDFSRRIASKTLDDEKITAFLTIVIRDGVPYIITDAKSPLDALKIIPDILAVGTQLVETCIQGSVEAYDMIEKLKKSLDSLEDDPTP